MGAFKSRACEAELTGEPKKNREQWCAGHKQRELGAPATPALCAESGDGAKVTKQGCARPQHGGVWRQSRKWRRPARMPSQDALLTPLRVTLQPPFPAKGPLRGEALLRWWGERTSAYTASALSLELKRTVENSVLTMPAEEGRLEPKTASAHRP